MDDEDDVQSADAEETDVVAAEGICRYFQNAAESPRARRRSTEIGTKENRGGVVIGGLRPACVFRCVHSVGYGRGQSDLGSWPADRHESAAVADGHSAESPEDQDLRAAGCLAKPTAP